MLDKWHFIQQRTFKVSSVLQKKEKNYERKYNLGGLHKVRWQTKGVDRPDHSDDNDTFQLIL